MCNVRNVVVFLVVGVVLCMNSEAGAFWIGMTSPASYGTKSGTIENGKTPVILEQGDSTVYEFTFRGIFGSPTDCYWIPQIKIGPWYDNAGVFFSFDAVEVVKERVWDAQFLAAGETVYFPFTVYVSNPQLEPTLPGEYYQLGAAWSPLLESPGGGITLTGKFIGVIRFQVTPEPATLSVFGLGSFIFLKRNSRKGLFMKDKASHQVVRV